MIDCSRTENYFKEKARMTKNESMEYANLNVQIAL